MSTSNTLQLLIIFQSPQKQIQTENKRKGSKKGDFGVLKQYAESKRNNLDLQSI